MALLVGIAIDKGQIGSVDDKVLDYFPDYNVKRGEKTIYDVTIRHLLTMRAPYKGKGDPWSKVCSSDNWTSSSLDFLGGRKGLTDEFDYRTVCLHVLSGILYNATNMKTVEYANETVESDYFRGMDYGYLWWIIDRKKNIYAAIGNSGNVIYVNPEKNIVIAVSSYFKPTIFDRVDFIQEYIEPLITE